MKATALRLLAVLVLIAAALPGCGGELPSLRELAGLPATNDPSVDIKPAENKWLLIKNPRFGDVASEPEYIWVEDDKVPTTMGTLIFGKDSLIAPPEIVPKYGSPPGGGRISPRQKMAVSVEPAPPPAKAGAKGAATAAATTAIALPANRGFVVFVDTSRVVIDLNGKDGVRPGAQVSVRRDKIAIVHPVTGELLGELDEEVATGRVTEVRDKFSVVELSTVATGNQVKVKDRVVIR
jgi:hypothetical protein